MFRSVAPAGTSIVQYWALEAAPEMPVTGTPLASTLPPLAATVTVALLLWLAPWLSVTVRVTL